MQDTYHSLQRYIRLPDKIKLTQKIFELIQVPSSSAQTGEENPLSEPLLHKTNDLLDQLNQTFEVFANPDTFEFTFPESMFPAVPENQVNDIRYEQKMISEQENTFKNRLSQEQLQEIQEKGEFKVKSNIEYITLPYVWKINQTIFWGKEKVQKTWMKSLATIYGFFWQAHNLLTTVIPQKLLVIKSIPSSLFRIFFGKKSLQTVVPVDYDREIYKEFWDKILKNHYQENDQWFDALWKYLMVYYDPEMEKIHDPNLSTEEQNKLNLKRKKIIEKYQKQIQVSDAKMASIESCSSSFFIEWNKLRKRIVIEITEEVNTLNNSIQHNPVSEDDFLNEKKSEEETDAQILEKLVEKKFSIYIETMRTQLQVKHSVPLDVVKAIVVLLKIFQLISVQESKVSKQKLRRRKEVENRVMKEFKIRSLFQPFFKDTVDKELKPINSSLDQDLIKNLFKNEELSGLISKDQEIAFREFLNLRFQYDIVKEAKKAQVPEYHAPTRVFYSNYHLIPPYKIYQDSNHNYYLKKISDDITVKTNQDFWKLRLYWMRLKTWTINSLVYLSMSVWKGPVGIRALWGVDDFDCDMNINFKTGEIYYEKSQPVLGVFKTVLKGIKKSRNTFQQAPDLGLLGKNVSRYFNYIQCYIFRFLFVGILLVLIGFPILIFVASFLTFVLVLTFWAWMPLVLTLTYLFNIFIKQFETAYEERGFMSRTFPLVRVVLKLFFSLGIMLLALLNLVVWTPIKALIWLIVSSLTYLFRRLLDKVMMCIFSKLGRTPSRDTLIAKKISGPGMTKDFYMSINEEDVYVLIRSHLQIELMIKIQQLVIQKINSQSKIMNSVINYILKPFKAQFYGQNVVEQSCSRLMRNFNKQYKNFMNRYPSNPRNVRFTQEQIDNYFPNTVEIVQNFVLKLEIHSWIFEKHQLYQGMYEDLTRSIWINIFGCGQEIFEPLEKLDARFKLQDQYKDDNVFNSKMKKGVGSVMKALEGEVSLNHHHKKVSPFKHNLLSRELPIEHVTTILNLHRWNSRKSINLNLNNPRSFFIPNLNVPQIKIVDSEARQNSIRQNKHIVDL